MPPRLKIIIVVFLLLGSFVFAINQLANAITSPTPQVTPDAATTEKAKSEFLAKICSGHGGVNCSVINQEATIVCNDGTIDNSFPTIYGIPECQTTINNKADQESDFMSRSGCYPPSEMGCFNNQSYQNLLKILSDSGLANSELGQGNLAQCHQQILDYQIKNSYYKQCLIQNNNPQFNPSSGRAVLPLLKTVFCPIFYGPKSSYNQDANLCICAKGYFMSDGACTDANSICQSKYGPAAYVQNGNCLIKKPPVQNLQPIPTIKTYKPPPRLSISLSVDYSSGSTITPAPTISTPIPLEINPSSEPQDHELNLFLRIINSFVSSMKNILKLL